MQAPPEHPLHAPKLPHRQSLPQVRERVRLPQLPVQDPDSTSVWPIVHSPPPPPEHVPKEPHAPQNPLTHVRVRSSVPPQLPQARLSRSMAPAVHSGGAEQSVHSPQLHEAPHIRTCGEPSVQARVSDEPIGHKPSPEHEPEFSQRPPAQTWFWSPQAPHGITWDAPSVQPQAAEHSPQSPSLHVSTPSPHVVEQVRLPMRPTSGLESSQSTSTGNPSSSASTPAAMHRLSTQLSSTRQLGTHPLEVSMSRRTTSITKGPLSERPVDPDPPDAQAATKMHVARQARSTLQDAMQKGEASRSGQKHEGERHDDAQEEKHHGGVTDNFLRFEPHDRQKR